MSEGDRPLNKSERETLAIPDSVRRIIDERDGQHCRVCGKFLGEGRAIHHIIFGGDARGMGGRRVHNPDEMVTVCWMYGHKGALPCHDLVHQQKRTWQPLLLEVARRKGITAIALRRWQIRNRNKNT